ncbi:MAG: class I SAM-dependent methyltransferase [Candidatus Cyclobacteriaceae bacterium M3_2C_046]
MNTIFSLPGLQAYQLKYPPGHFYNPIPDHRDILRRFNQIYDNITEKALPGLDLNAEYQYHLLSELVNYYNEFPYKESNKPGLRYYPHNNMFDWGDAFFLFAFLRHFKPVRYLEVGSGFSSALLLDTVDHFFKNRPIHCCFIEPYPHRLEKLLKPEDYKKNRIRIEQNIVQQVNPELFNDLEENDILFIDNSHISKLGSDVNYLLFEILPRLKKGVIIHIHDIPFPFEYNSDFFLKNKEMFNEAYILRAFLMYNSQFEIIQWPSFMMYQHPELFRDQMPEVLESGAVSFWLRKK